MGGWGEKGGGGGKKRKRELDCILLVFPFSIAFSRILSFSLCGILLYYVPFLVTFVYISLTPFHSRILLCLMCFTIIFLYFLNGCFFVTVFTIFSVSDIHYISVFFFPHIFNPFVIP